jgi:hypothetical protein
MAGREDVGRKFYIWLTEEDGTGCWLGDWAWIVDRQRVGNSARVLGLGLELELGPWMAVQDAVYAVEMLTNPENTPSRQGRYEHFVEEKVVGYALARCSCGRWPLTLTFSRTLHQVAPVWTILAPMDMC